MITKDGSPDACTALRMKAISRLQTGTTPATSQGQMGIDALQLLYKLSCDPSTASDALKLLHELQVHQVELDLQNEAIAANEQAMAGELAYYRDLFDCAPPAYLVTDHDGVVVQGNLAAVELFGIEQGSLPGRRIDSLVAPSSRQALQDFMQRVAGNGLSDSVWVESVGHAGVPRLRLVLVARQLGHTHVAFTCNPFPNERE